jgi:glycosyltransferase involved in cell wall biosynthesis
MMMENNAPKISIITVTFNAGLSLEQTINSVAEQSYKNIEYIIVDGGSTDGTIDLLKKYNGQIAQWISEPDRGVYDAMNKAVTMATGNWIYFL